jgi:hypothetical protein
MSRILAVALLASMPVALAAQDPLQTDPSATGGCRCR